MFLSLVIVLYLIVTREFGATSWILRLVSKRTGRYTWKETQGQFCNNFREDKDRKAGNCQEERSCSLKTKENNGFWQSNHMKVEEAGASEKLKALGITGKQDQALVRI